MQWVNASAARSSAADGARWGPPKCMPTGCSFAQAFSAPRNAGKNGLGSAPFEPGSKKVGKPFARMQSENFSACAPADPELLDESIGRLSDEIEQRIAPFAAQRDLLMSIPGVKPRTADVPISEIGVDMTLFPTPKHLAS
jgi:hypothetical protein